MIRNELTAILNRFLKPEEFNDLCPNGLQVEGREKVKKIITAVSASVQLFEQAIQEKADTIIVHHGIIWNFERPLYRGGYRERVRLLLQNDINLYGYHLPLDAHPRIGNNARLCQLIGLGQIEPFGDYNGQYIGMRGEIASTDKNLFFDNVAATIESQPTIFDYGPDKIRTVGVISGGAQKEIKQAVAAGLDVFITGEISEHIMHYAHEEKIHFIAAGHYATEKFGIMALGDWLKKQGKLDVRFIDIPNPA